MGYAAGHVDQQRDQYEPHETVVKGLLIQKLPEGDFCQNTADQKHG